MELVAARRREIEHGLGNNHNISTSSIVGAYQDITRNNLALWDSSARAWLRRADQAKEWSECQLSLIVKNISTPIPSGPSTYEQVISVWTGSMLAVEQFLAGKPQEITDGSIFFALSAWHLYPDLIVLGAEPRKVEFNDKLIPSSAVGTIGVQSKSPGREGIQWSLALSHLEYYGDPVVVSSDQDSSRLTFSQLQVVALGGLLGRWKISPRDYLLVAEWFKLLWSRMAIAEEDIHNGRSAFGWLSHLVSAATQLLTVDDQDRKHNLLLLKHGTRRAKGFLSHQDCNHSPFFGLLNDLTLRGLLEELDVDSGVAYLRAVAKELGLRQGDAVICYAHDASHQNLTSSVEYFELATVQRCDLGMHTRWISPNGQVKPVQSSVIGVKLKGKFDGEGSPLEDRICHISSQGEICRRHMTGPDYNTRIDRFSWLDPPPIYWPDSSVFPPRGHDDTTRPLKRSKVDVDFLAIIGDWRLGLFVRSEASGAHN